MYLVSFATSICMIPVIWTEVF